MVSIITEQQQTLARDVVNATRELNEAIRDAQRAGLRVDVSHHHGFWGELRDWIQSTVSMSIETTATKPTHKWEDK